MKKIIGYVRMSTEDQTISPEMQKGKIEAYCNLHDLELVDIFSDLGISAKNITKRPGFQDALINIYHGRADGLLVWKLDRAFRSTQDALEVVGKLNKIGKAFMSINESIDTTSATGEFFFTILAAIAQMERKLIGERTSAALQSKIANGERCGSIKIGYRLGEDGKTLVIDANERTAIILAKSFRKLDGSLRSISKKLALLGYLGRNGKPWSPSSVATMLKESINEKSK